VRVAEPHEPIEGVHWIGDTYVFGSLRRGGPAITGKTSAPPPGSAPDRLVGLSHALREYVLADEPVLPDVAARVRTEAEWFHAIP
jgi:hypothetical protein